MKTASTEREAIVAYLRSEAALFRRLDQHSRGHDIEWLAEAIRLGKHLKDQDHGRA